MASQETFLNERYRLVAQQGSGGMAVIYRAIDQTLGRTVAVKVLRPSLITDPAFLERFRNEARHIARLTHPNIVTIHDFRQDKNTYYIVMEFIEGQDLKKLIRTEAPFSVERMLSIAIQICAGVGYAHRSGLVHADVKPQNVLIKEHDQVKVTDFGIALALSDASIADRQRVVWGSPHYFSPEQAQGERPTPASDVYSIGIVMFEMLTGRLPFVGADQQELALAHIRDTPPKVTDFNPAVPAQLEQIILKIMSKEPASRYRTAEQLERILINYRDRGYEATGGVQSPVRKIAASSPPTQPRAQQPVQVAGPLPTPPGAQSFESTGEETPSSPPTAPYPPQPPPVYNYEHTQPEYDLSDGIPRRIDKVTIALSMLAILAVSGLLLLWAEVFRVFGS